MKEIIVVFWSFWLGIVERWNIISREKILDFLCIGIFCITLKKKIMFCRKISKKNYCVFGVIGKSYKSY